VSGDSTATSDAPVAIVTGVSSGIGWGTAAKLVADGMCVVGSGRNTERLEALEAEIGNPERFITVAGDLTADETPGQIVEATLKRFGKINYLVNNAGVGMPKALLDTDDATLDYFLNILLRAPFRMARDALFHMKAGSAIINITSTFAVVGGIRGGAYSAAKAGLHGLTTHIACHYGATGVRANSVAPGIIQTPMIEGRMNDMGFRKINQEMTPHTRLGKVEDIASTVAFLCSPGGEFLNGQHIVVDGGWTSTKFLSEFGRTSTWTAAES
jgi:NAD(P)-dependent dehydrogenase (short-subunit alcohol dehydrogenase family)